MYKPRKSRTNDYVIIGLVKSTVFEVEISVLSNLFFLEVFPFQHDGFTRQGLALVLVMDTWFQYGFTEHAN